MVIFLLVGAQSGGVVLWEILRVHLEDLQKELLGEESCLDLHAIFSWLHTWNRLAKKIGGSATGEDAARSMLVDDDEDRDIVRQSIDVYDL